MKDPAYFSESESSDLLDLLYQLEDFAKREVNSTSVTTGELADHVLASFSYTTHYGETPKTETKITLNSKYYHPRQGSLEDVLKSELAMKKSFDEIYGRQDILEVLGHEMYHKISHTKGMHNSDEEGKATVFGKLYKFASYFIGKVADPVKTASGYVKKELEKIKKVYNHMGVKDTFYNNYLNPAMSIIEREDILGSLKKDVNYSLPDYS